MRHAKVFKLKKPNKSIAIETKQVLEELRKDVAVIKHILSEEERLNQRIKKQLAEARTTPDSQYISHKELKKSKNF